MTFRGNLTLRSVDAYPYNCVGMIFAARRAWIEIDHIYPILREDDYTKVQREDVMVGDIVLYRDAVEPTHVALIVAVDSIGNTTSLKVMSKWGMNPEFIHDERNVPQILGQPAEYFTDRKRHEKVTF